jgi:hypothetical protein
MRPLPIVDTRHVPKNRAIVGSLMCVASVTRPDLMHAASELAQHLAEPLEGDMKWPRHALRYLNTTKDLVLQYHKHQGLTIAGHAALASVWSDAGYVGCEESAKAGLALSSSCLVHPFGGQARSSLAWSSGPQPRNTLPHSWQRMKRSSSASCSLIWVTAQAQSTSFATTELQWLALRA